MEGVGPALCWRHVKEGGNEDPPPASIAGVRMEVLNRGAAAADVATATAIVATK
eukprot:CAMPEP_0202418432 /NCGR_PEP_ID=MMETSP1128-20130828/46291_1 /ASSEMBLY_ACC=CAM_ASM_000463 /TAXON_ID=3047 /ORGANISM="Dunaliella tertiolecta, Strain CCMP1320" /LENGTH=53 /DNA_ID=CAMNT_0049026087 /DNA_START=399 /DNA_END=560 /DNA_ORIENTATION=-